MAHPSHHPQVAFPSPYQWWQIQVHLLFLITPSQLISTKTTKATRSFKHPPAPPPKPAASMHLTRHRVLRTKRKSILDSFRARIEASISSRLRLLGVMKWGEAGLRAQKWVRGGQLIGWIWIFKMHQRMLRAILSSSVEIVSLVGFLRMHLKIARWRSQKMEIMRAK